ncbi:MAG: DUF5681 domain-containing protein [Bacteroidales bacterium]
MNRQTEKQLANLKPFQKGETGNPEGRPSGTFGLTKMLRTALQGDQTLIADGELLDDSGQPTGKMVKVRMKMPRAEAIVSRVIHKAATGDMKAVEFVYDRIEGKARQTVTVNGNIFDGEDRGTAKFGVKEIRDAARD